MRIASTSILLSIISAFLATIDPIVAMPAPGAPPTSGSTVVYKPKADYIVGIPMYVGRGAATRTRLVVQFSSKDTVEGVSGVIDLRGVDRIAFPVHNALPANCILHFEGSTFPEPKVFSGPFPPRRFLRSTETIEWDNNNAYDTVKATCYRR
ncbi:hypothetical protein C8R42DRAFT_687291 [Lentinula raphanica]|nr:hypothetical protein C8R42DRAFT_687291 [Lentinula raphanica]